MRRLLLLCTLLLSGPVAAEIPATPLMTLYSFNGPLELPYYEVGAFQKSGTAATPAGTLTQGTSLIPCLVIRDGRPLTDGRGIPFVGFQVVVDPRQATRASTAAFRQAVAERRALRVANHHCGKGVRHVLDVRNLYAMEKAPFFDPPAPGTPGKPPAPQRSAGAEDGCERRECAGLDAIVRAFHESAQCAQVNRNLLGRREALDRAWDGFSAAQRGRWPDAELARARQLDYTLRTAIFEGHLDRGCSAYGACERNVIALTIRNRGRESCSARQGCSEPGDFQGVASKVSQYNIWDELLTQISGLTSCYLRPDLSAAAQGKDGAGARYYEKLQRMHAQSLDDVQRILFGDDEDLRRIFPGVALGELRALRHYYHAPAMGKCFPQHERAEYLSGAVASRGEDFALLANLRIHVDRKVDGGYLFREFSVREEPDRDVITLLDRYPGFVVDGARVSLGAPTRCVPYGISAGCKIERVGRYRKTPPWLDSGRPLELPCRIRDRGAQCQGEGTPATARVGGTCDREMRPITAVP